MNKFKSALIIGAGVATVGVSGTSLAATSAAMNGGGSASTSVHAGWKDEFDAKLSTTLAAKYSLNADEVKTVIEQVRTQMIDEKRFAALKQALSDGKITQAQYDHIVTAVKEIDSLRQSLRQATTDAERDTIKAELKTKTSELWTWLKEQKVSAKLIGYGTFHTYENYRHDGSSKHHSRH